MPIIFADPHAHNWASFSNTLSTGVNSRLQDTLNAMSEACDRALETDKKVVIAGDIFHTRGHIVPSVFNAVKNLIDDYIKKGINFFILAGNHDAEEKNATENKTSLDTFRQNGCVVVSEGFEKIQVGENTNYWLFAWYDNVKELKNVLEQNRTDMNPEDLVFMHTPISGVVPRIFNAIDSEYLYSLPCKYVFSGHIHLPYDHKGKVFSIGSLTQQTMGDYGQNVGYIELTPKGTVIRTETKAPKFINLNKSEIDDSLCFAHSIKNNFVRITLDNVAEEDKKAIEKKLLSMKPRKLDVIYTKKTVSARKDGVAYKTIDKFEITKRFVDKQNFEHKEETLEAAGKILEAVGEKIND